MKEKVQAAIDKIRPMLKADGGDVELVDVSAAGVVQVRLQGACSGCPIAMYIRPSSWWLFSCSGSSSTAFFSACQA